jgi:hypothetical protein
MSHDLINEHVDIYQPPSFDERYKSDTAIQITIGDLHGNAMKLMFLLVKHGIATNLNDNDYFRLVEIYIWPLRLLTKQHLDDFNRILSNITFHAGSLVRLIGDELADRGSNDYFTLKILEKLKQHHVPVEIILSNHGVEFIEAYEKQDAFVPPMLFQYASSMISLQYLIEQGLVERDEIIAIANNSYKPTLRALSYSRSDNNITIYSHAGIGLNTIQTLAQKLEVDYQDTTTDELAQTIDNINAAFQQYVQSNTVNTLYTRDKMLQGYSGYVELCDAPFEFIMWNRVYDNIHRPTSQHDYSMHFVHGHDTDDKQYGSHIFNLDNLLGKGQYFSQGAYTVLYSKKEEMVPQISVVNTTEEHDIQHPVPTLSESHNHFLSQLEDIRAKGLELRRNGHIVAADCAQALYDSVSNEHQQLVLNEIDLSTFKNNCQTAINIARPELEKHRGWKQILGNLALAVVGLGVLYVIAGLINKAVTGHFLFFKTDSAHKVDQLAQSIQSINAP